MKSRVLLLTTAIIWGFAFVAQRSAMEFIQPFSFNAVRFIIGAISLLPVLGFRREPMPAQTSRRTMWLGGVLAGSALFIGGSLQQIGVVYTTAGKAGFITGLYVILVPLSGILLKHRTGIWTWLGAAAGVLGLYLLTVTDALTIAYGDVLVLIGAFFWAAHVLIIDYFAPRVGAIRLSAIQLVVCGLASLGVALVFESLQAQNIVAAAVPILYTGILSVGVAYTFQVLGQKGTPPAQSAIILSLEGAFAVIGGGLLLGETLPVRGLVGCALMFIGMIVSQLDTRT